MFNMLLGHLVGDFVLQNDWLALNKGKYNLLGWVTCLIHCIIYTLSVCVLMWNFNIYWIACVFLSHFPMDKFGLGEKYLKLIRGRSLERFLNEPEYDNRYVGLSKREIALKGGFTAFCYVVTENTIHLLVMFIMYSLLFG